MKGTEMKTPEKVYRAYTTYGKNPLCPTEVLESVKQSRLKWQCRPVSKLYTRTVRYKGSHYESTFLLKALMDSGMSYEEACKHCK